MLFRASKWPHKSRTRKLGNKTPKLKNCQNEPIRIRGRPLTSIWINHPYLGSNGIHCDEFPHHMRNFLLNLAPGEPLALVQELPCFDNSIKSNPLLLSDLDMCVHSLIIGFMFHAVGVDLCWCQLLFYL
jgi:hypothetical protein